ncbi:hypothetical protein ACRBEV_22490 [Methylobacterium phyllosphaerae]
MGDLVLRLKFNAAEECDIDLLVRLISRKIDHGYELLGAKNDFLHMICVGFAMGVEPAPERRLIEAIRLWCDHCSPWILYWLLRLAR